MSRAPSPATEIRSLKHENKELRSRALFLERDCRVYRSRASKAEKDMSEWKDRFDILLSKAGMIQEEEQ